MRTPVAQAVLAVGLALALGLALHLLVGWSWVVAAAVVAGVVAPRSAGVGGGAVLAGLGVALGWGGLLIWNHVRYEEPVGRMTEAMGTILGGLPPGAVPVLSLAVGLVLGLLGGAVGAGARNALRPAQG